MIRISSGQGKNPLLQGLENGLDPILHSDPELDELQRDCRELEQLRQERRKLWNKEKKLKKKWANASPDRDFQDPLMKAEWQRYLREMQGDGSDASRQDTGRKKGRSADDRRSAEEEARTLGEITEACDRLGKLSNDMLKLYGGKDGVQRLQMMVKSIPQRPVKSVEEQLLETRIRQLAAAWREYKGIQSRFADPAYDRPLADPGLEEARKARLRMLREPHESQAVYDALEARACERQPRGEGEEA